MPSPDHPPERHPRDSGEPLPRGRAEGSSRDSAPAPTPEPVTAARWGSAHNEWVVRSAVCTTASFGAALLWVLVHRGFGAVDLFGFAIGSLPFGLWMAGVSHLFREVVHRPHGWGRLGAVAALALIGALVWTIATTLLFGPWMAGFDLPVAWLWAIGGLVALVP